MSKEQIQAFLYLVATIPAFRAKLETDPIGFFADLGVALDPNVLPEGGVKVPSNEEILANLDAIADNLYEEKHFEDFGWIRFW